MRLRLYCVVLYPSKGMSSVVVVDKHRRAVFDAVHRRLGAAGVVGWLYIQCGRRCPGDPWTTFQVHVVAADEFRASSDPLVRFAVAILRNAMLNRAYEEEGVPGLISTMRLLFGHLVTQHTPDCDLLRAFELAAPCATNNEEGAILRNALRTLHDARDAEMLHNLCLDLPERGWMAATAYLRGRLNDACATRLDQMHVSDKLRALVGVFSLHPSPAVNVAVAVLNSSLTPPI